MSWSSVQGLGIDWLVLGNEPLPLSRCVVSSLLLYFLFLSMFYIFRAEWSWQLSRLRDP